MTEEEVKALEEALEEARGQAERYRETAGEQGERIAELEGRLTGLEATAQEREQAQAAREEEFHRREEEAAGLREQLVAGVARYRCLLLAAVPEVPEELVKGETMEEVDASLAAAREMVEGIKRRLEAKLATERIPVGAPVRAAPDVSALSPREKIALALTRQ